jgi:hypothetical protein
LNLRTVSRDNGAGERQGAVRPARRKTSSNPP